MKIKLISIFFILSSIVFASNSAKINFEVLNHGTNAINSYPEKKFVIYNEQSSFEKEFKNYNHTKMPKIDFENSFVALLTMGWKSSGGYFIKVEDVKVNDDEVQIITSFVSPGKTCGSFAAITNPYVFIKVPKSSKINFVQNDIVKQCE